MSNVLRKIQVGNPLYNLELTEDAEAYDNCETDEQLTNWFHTMLEKHQGRTMVEAFVNAMIAYATGKRIYPEQLIEAV